MIIETFTGGIFDTNCFYLPDAKILIDAPQDTAEWLASRGFRVDLLLLTHGHIDHVWDAARIEREHRCEVAYHAETEPMVKERDFFVKFGFAWEIAPVEGGRLIDEASSSVFGSVEFATLLVPGHCPGSLCFFAKEERVLFGGDVLFAGGIGRWDLPGGDRELLLSGIRGKVFPLGDDVSVLPGHGPRTTVGRERATNPFLSETE